MEVLQEVGVLREAVRALEARMDRAVSGLSQCMAALRDMKAAAPAAAGCDDAREDGERVKTLARSLRAAEENVAELKATVRAVEARVDQHDKEHARLADAAGDAKRVATLVQHAQRLDSARGAPPSLARLGLVQTSREVERCYQESAARAEELAVENRVLKQELKATRRELSTHQQQQRQSQSYFLRAQGVRDEPGAAAPRRPPVHLELAQKLAARAGRRESDRTKATKKPSPMALPADSPTLVVPPQVENLSVSFSEKPTSAAAAPVGRTGSILRSPGSLRHATPPEAPAPAPVDPPSPPAVKRVSSRRSEAGKRTTGEGSRSRLTPAARPASAVTSTSLGIIDMVPQTSRTSIAYQADATSTSLGSIAFQEDDDAGVETSVASLAFHPDDGITSVASIAFQEENSVAESSSAAAVPQTQTDESSDDESLSFDPA
eukprot:TRINITY_DN22567_c0_g1_i1.p1 TRINITY_DN22567_c0_g1~~TRINITY_DN22567_c0_g1_i1.p1  ORF type:complete len:436 (+),score=173.34 TRINITY_DN22567_c0_g1_i1:60-1367(+)